MGSSAQAAGHREAGLAWWAGRSSAGCPARRSPVPHVPADALVLRMKKSRLRSAKGLPESQRVSRKGRRQDSHSALLPHLHAPPPVSPGGSDLDPSAPPGPDAANLSPPLAAIEHSPAKSSTRRENPIPPASQNLLRRDRIGACPSTAARALHPGSGTWGSARRVAGGGDAGSEEPRGRSGALRGPRAHRGARVPAPYRPPRAPGRSGLPPRPERAPRGPRLPFRKGIAEKCSRDAEAERRPSASPVARGRLRAPGVGRGRGKGHIWAKAGASPAEGGTAAEREARPQGGPRGNRLTLALPVGRPSPAISRLLLGSGSRAP